jgi:hypothetical protein
MQVIEHPWPSAKPQFCYFVKGRKINKVGYFTILDPDFFYTAW